MNWWPGYGQCRDVISGRGSRWGLGLGLGLGLGSEPGSGMESTRTLPTCCPRGSRPPRLEAPTRAPAPAPSTAGRPRTRRPRTGHRGYDAAAQTIELAYDDSLVTSGTAPLTGVDNVTGTSSGDLFVAEDGGNLEICVITPDDVIAPFLRVNGRPASEITGPAFSPDGRRLYFSSRRGTSGSSSGGITYEVTGPFRNQI